MGEEELHHLIGSCIAQDRLSQKMLYKAFYGFCMGICLRYASDRDEAAGVMNQGFLKVFKNLDTYDRARPFKAWIGRIMVNISIDHYRSKLKWAYTEEIEKADHVSNDDYADRKLNYDDLLKLVQNLPPAYRLVFNLFAVEGYSHEEIGKMLNISVGTSKSNLFKARQKLKQMIFEADLAPPGNRYQSGTDYNPIIAIKKVESPGIYFDKNTGI